MTCIPVIVTPDEAAFVRKLAMESYCDPHEVAIRNAIADKMGDAIDRMRCEDGWRRNRNAAPVCPVVPGAVR